MKKVVIQIAKTTLIVLSFFIIYINSISNPSYTINKQPFQKEQSQSFLKAKIDLIYSNLQNEQFSNLITYNYSLTFKKHINDFSFQEKSLGFLNNNLIIQFISDTKTILYSFESIILLFPFHYFW